MQSPFRNSVLLVVFNYADCVHNKEFIDQLYGRFFKRIIFYSDLPKKTCELIQESRSGRHWVTCSKPDRRFDVNYVSTNKGYFGYRIVQHFKQNYRDLLDSIDGIFYTMDDNIMNANMLSHFNTNNIIYHSRENRPIKQKIGWWWQLNEGGKHGNLAIRNLEKDASYQCYGVQGYSGDFSDYFYVPKRYLTDQFFSLFDIFSKYEVFLEIAIPTILNHIEPDPEKYQIPNVFAAWESKERSLLERKKSFYDIFRKGFLFVHPVKFNSNPESKKWLTEIFNNENE